MVPCMSSSKRAHLTLELDLAPGRICGSLQDERGEPRPFEGWVQLTNALEAVRAGARERTAETSSLISNHPPTSEAR